MPRIVRLAVAVGLLALAAAQPSARAGPEQAAAVCSAAGKLIDSGLPQQARSLVVATLQTAKDPCLDRTEQKAAAAIDKADETARAAEAKAGTDRETAREFADMALKMDAENALAKHVKSSLPKATVAKRLKDRWDKLFNDSLEPLEDLVLPFLAVFAALVFLARLAALSPWKWFKTGRKGRGGLWVGGLLLTATASGLLTVGVAEWNDWSRHYELTKLALPIGAVIAAVLAVAITASAIATRLRLNIEVHDGEGKASEAATGHVIALLGELGAEPPRGLEVPRGADVMALAGTPIAGTPTGKLVSAFMRVWQLALGSTPWRVRVDVESDDVHAVVITRNGHAVASMVIDRDQLRLRTPIADKSNAAEATPRLPDLHRFSAAAILTTVAGSYYGFEGLFDVTDWRSLGLHYVATTDYASPANLSAHKKALVLALEIDPRNVPARVALRRSQDRLSRDREILHKYITWLLETSKEDIWGKPGRGALRRRIRMTLLAVACNRGALEADWAPPEDVITQADELIRDLAKSHANDDVLVEAMRPSAAAAYLSLGGDARKEMARQWLEREYRLAPHANYNYGCLRARQPLRNPQQAPFPPDRPQAVEHLRLACADEEIREWMATDPWLSELRKTPEYRTQFLNEKRTDFLALDPLAKHADDLRAAGLQTADELAVVSSGRLAAYLKVDVLVATRLVNLAQMATTIGPKLHEFMVEITDALLTEGLDSLAELETRLGATGNQAFAKTLHQTIHTHCREEPDSSELLDWLNRL